VVSSSVFKLSSNMTISLCTRVGSSSIKARIFFVCFNSFLRVLSGICRGFFR